MVEGLLNGLPVVVSPEANNENWAHLVYQVDDPDDPEAWATCIRKVCRHGVDPMRAAAIRKFQSSFDNSDSVKTLACEVFHAP